MKKVILILVVLVMNAFSFTLFSCIGEQTGTDKSLNQMEIKSDNLSNILRKTDKMPYLISLVILKNGKLVVEEYVNGGGPDQIHDIRSASKSVLSAIITKATGMSTLEYATQALFSPLGIKKVLWEKIQMVVI